MTNDRVIPKSDINYNDIRKTYSVYVCMSENTEHVPILFLYMCTILTSLGIVSERKYGYILLNKSTTIKLIILTSS